MVTIKSKVLKEIIKTPRTPKQLPKSKETKAEKAASTEPQTMEELLAQFGGKSLAVTRGQVVEGKIISINPHEILVDVGAKAEGIITGRELSAVSDLVSGFKVGDKVMAQVVQPESDTGQVILSLRQTSGEKRWQDLKEKQDKDELVEVRVLDINRGGLMVVIDDLRGFIPSSQLEPEHLANLSNLISQTLKVKVIELDQPSNRLLFSEKEANRQANKKRAQKTLAGLKIGNKVKGVVTAVLPFGVFVNVDGVEGLVHISEISWEKVTNPGQFFKIGDEIEAQVVNLDRETGKLNLSVKQLSTDPWEEISRQLEVGQKVHGTITKIVPFGIFVRLSMGIDGLLHSSKISAGTNFETDQEIDCLIETLNTQTRRIGLSLP